MAGVVIVLQARMASCRLPGKALESLGPQSVLFHCLTRRLQQSRLGTVVLATTNGAEDDLIEFEAARCGVTAYRGSTDDVLSRFAAVAAASGADYVVRALGSNPAVDATAVGRLLKALRAAGADYAVEDGLPHGAEVEVMTAAALRRCADHAWGAGDREQVTSLMRRLRHRIPDDRGDGAADALQARPAIHDRDAERPLLHARRRGARGVGQRSSAAARSPHRRSRRAGPVSRGGMIRAIRETPVRPDWRPAPVRATPRPSPASQSGSASVLAGQAIEGGTVGTLLQGAAALIVFGGTLGAVLLSFSAEEVWRAAASLGSVFVDRLEPAAAAIGRLTRYATRARRLGMLSLEVDLGRRARSLPGARDDPGGRGREPGPAARRHGNRDGHAR